MLYFPHNFLFVPSVVNWVTNYIGNEEVYDKLQFKQKVYNDIKTSSFIPKKDRLDLDDIINPELHQLGLPLFQYLHIFIWPPFSGGYYEGHNTDIHLDLYPHLRGRDQKQAAYNIPVIGYNEDCYFEWYNGTVKMFREKTKHDPSNELTNTTTKNKLTFHWYDGPHLAGEVVQTQPYFVAINVPHRVRTGKDVRVVASLRFENTFSVRKYHQLLAGKNTQT